VTFTQIQDKNLPVDDLDFSSDVNGGERVVSSDHDALSERKKNGDVRSENSSLSKFSMREED